MPAASNCIAREPRAAAAGRRVWSLRICAPTSAGGTASPSIAFCSMRPVRLPGVIRRHPDIKLLRRAGDIAGFAVTQRRCWTQLPVAATTGRTAAVFDLLAAAGRKRARWSRPRSRPIRGRVMGLGALTRCAAAVASRPRRWDAAAARQCGADRWLLLCLPDSDLEAQQWHIDSNIMRKLSIVLAAALALCCALVAPRLDGAPPGRWTASSRFAPPSWWSTTACCSSMRISSTRSTIASAARCRTASRWRSIWR